MKILLITGITLLVMLAIMIIFLAINGFFSKIEVKEKTDGPFVIVYEKHIGDFKEIGKITDRVYDQLTSMSIESTKGFGIYYDNPQNTPKEKLRSIAGCIVENKTLQELSDSGIDYTIAQIPKCEIIYADFPLKNNMSYMIGPMKVYPKLGKYIQKNSYKTGPMMEIYDMPNNIIRYIAIKNIGDDFFESLLH